MYLKEKFKRNKGITLIALVVTIIVLLILAGISIMMLTGQNGILNKAKEAKEQTTVSQKNEEENLNTMLDLIEENISSNNEYKGITITEKSTDVIFLKADGTTEGDINNLETGDIVKFGDYEYHYNQKYYANPFGVGWSTEDAMDGWGVKVIDRDKTKYGELCGTIFGKKLKNIDYLFGHGANAMACQNIQESPKIPYGVVSMGSTYQGCENLKTAETIPSSVINMDYVFSDCKNLEGTIIINANPQSYHNWYGGEKAITITGSSKILGELASGHSNITIK